MSNPFRPIPREEITSVDIMCGKGKKCFNNTGNRRFRFIVAFNLERQREAPTRGAKSWVVDSILDQIREAGGRFVERVARDQDVWRQVSEKVAREKVSHALRDKCPLSTLTDAKSSLKRRLADPNRETDDFHFIAANERLLRVDLPGSQQATDEAVKYILTNEIESMGVSASTVSDSLFMAEQPQVSISSPPSARPREVIGGKWDELVYAIRSDNIFGRRFRSLDHKTSDDMFWSLNASFEPALVPRNVLLDEDRFFDDIYGQDHEHENFSYWNNDGDLPLDFNADDCENLVAMLDFSTPEYLFALNTLTN